MPSDNNGLQTSSQHMINQGALLFGGYAIVQACSLARNMLIACWLSKGEFGIAATILLVLQMVETLSDLGADRLIIQADDGDEPALMAGIHSTLIMRGILSGIMLYVLAEPTVNFFRIEEAKWAFELIALVPIIKGFAHMDLRRRQRRLDNAPLMIYETAPQILALALAWPLVAWTGNYTAAIWLALSQSAAAMVASHLVAERPYRLALSHAILKRIVLFGWPIWLSSFPLIAVYHADRAIIGRMFGMESLAAYAAAFLLTMVPALLASRVTHALLLPLLVEARGTPELYAKRYQLVTEIGVMAAATYTSIVIVAGDHLTEIAFGSNYSGLGTLLSWLAVMWALRMLQAIPGMAILATGNNGPLLIAGTIRASAIILALGAAFSGYGVAGIAAAGAVGEFASLIYVAFVRCVPDRNLATQLTRTFLARCIILPPAAAIAAGVKSLLPAGFLPMVSMPAAVVLVTATILFCIGLFPLVRGCIETSLQFIWKQPRNNDRQQDQFSTASTKADRPA